MDSLVHQEPDPAFLPSSAPATATASSPGSVSHTTTRSIFGLAAIAPKCSGSNPGAAGATALVQSKASGAFTHTHQRYGDVVRRAHGDAAGTRALVEVLLASYDNAMAESVNAIYKAELVYWETLGRRR